MLHRDSLFGQQELLFPETEYAQWPDSFSRDGKLLFGTAHRPGTLDDVWVYALREGNAEPRFLVDTSGRETGAALSPDGSWLVFESDGQLFLAPYGKRGTPQQLTTEGVSRAQWASNGTGVFYSHNRSIRVIEIDFENGVPNPGRSVEKVSLPPNSLTGVLGGRTWDIDSEEKRVLAISDEIEEADADTSSGARNTLQIDLNWFTALNEKVPVDSD